MQTRPSDEDGANSITTDSPRFYHLFIQEDLMGGWSLVRETGRQGYSGKVSKQHFDTWEMAQDAMMALRDKQSARGYHVVFLQGQAPPNA